jgi:1-acyl-sn-glycerol-3-phosphate acyltransferase
MENMPDSRYTMIYPRRRLSRFLIRIFFKGLLSLLFRIEISGEENFPKKGPLLVVGNHTGAMEVVLLNGFAPWQIEMLSAADMPAEKITEIINSLYGSIPLNRGAYDRAALSKALDVLKQNGFIGLFPEGGIWEMGKQKALPGISWLSYRSGAPILPIGFNNTAGAMNDGLKFKRPPLKMIIGQVLPPAKLPEGMAKKTYFQEHAAQIMDAVYSLVLAEQTGLDQEIKNEWFEMDFNLTDNIGETLEVPPNLRIQHASQLAKLLHRPLIMDLFTENLELPVHPLQRLINKPPVQDLILALESILFYLKEENPNLLTYRFGIPEGLGMQEGLRELLRILQWCSRNGHQISINAVRHYYSNSKQQEIVQREQEISQPWM